MNSEYEAYVAELEAAESKALRRSNRHQRQNVIFVLYETDHLGDGKGGFARPSVVAESSNAAQMVRLKQRYDRRRLPHHRFTYNIQTVVV